MEMRKNDGGVGIAGRWVRSVALEVSRGAGVEVSMTLAVEESRGAVEVSMTLAVEESRGAVEVSMTLAVEESRAEGLVACKKTRKMSEAPNLSLYISDLRSRIDHKTTLREKNSQSVHDRPDESALRKLDSSLKKTTAFVKKLKSLTESQRDQLVKDFNNLNLTKYVGEMATSLAEVKLKMNDVATAVELCSLAHQRYAEFAPALLEQWKKNLPRKKDDKIGNASKLRVDVRFYGELVIAGVLPEKEGLQLLGAVLAFLINTDKTEHKNLPIVTAFCRHCGEDYAGLVPRSIRVSSDKGGESVPQCTIINAERRKAVRGLLVDYYDSLAKHVLSDFKDMKKVERNNRWQYEHKGEVHPEAVQLLEEKRAALEKLKQSTFHLAELLDQDPPPLPEDTPDEGTEFDANTGMVLEMDTTFRGSSQEGSGLWEDEDTRQFYETLPELRVILPGILFKDSEQAQLEPVVEKIGEEEIEGEEMENSEEKEQTPEETVAEEAPEEETIPQTEPEAEAEEEPEDAEPETVSGSTLKLMMDAFTAQLPTFVNRDMIDKAAVDFVTNLNTKPNRKKLVKALYGVQRTRLDLLPFYSRLVAILKPVMPDLGTELVQSLVHEFRGQLRRKNQLHLESKLKVCRFLAELTKFGVCPKSEILHCFKQLLFDMRHHNIDMACAILDACGYFLFHSADSHQKTKILLEQMMRKKQAAPHLDQRYHLMLDNAFYACNPPPAGAIHKIVLPPLHEYIEKLICKDLNKVTVEKVLKQMRKVDWEDEELRDFCIGCLSSPWRVRFNCIQWLASVLAGLMWYNDWIGIMVVDNLLEDFRICAEINHPSLNQRRISVVKYLGEMYNYRVLDSSVIFSTLYSIITLGATFDPKIPSPMDPPEHLLRLRIACVLLETCGEYFSQGSSKRKLDCYLVYLQRYYWVKKEADFWTSDKPFPIESQNTIKDLMERLRPKNKLLNGLEAAEKAIQDIKEEYSDKIEAALKFLPSDEQGAEEEEAEDGLRPIDEQDEYADSSQEPAGESQEPVVYDEQEEHLNIHKMDSEHQPEDEDFLAAFDRMMSESVQQRMQESVPQPNFVVPQNARAKLEKKTKFADEEEIEEDNRSSPDTVGTERPMNFVLMTKGRGNKPMLKSVKVDFSSDLAQTMRDRENAELLEKEKLKQLTLNMSRRMEQEDLAEAEQQLRAAITLPHRPAQDERRGRGGGFRHQKGAPMPAQMFHNWQ